MAEGVTVSAGPGNLTFRPYRPGDEGGIFALFKTAYGRDRSLSHWRWKFCNNPAGQQIMLAVTGAGEVVGQYAGLPAWAAKDGRRYLLSQGVESMVHPRFRRGLQKPGVQVMLLQRFYEQYMGAGGGALHFGFPIPKYAALLAGTGMGTVLHRVIQVERGLSDGTSGLGRRSDPWRCRINEVTRFSADVDALWESCQPELPMAVIRDARYLNWRYAECPDGAYVKLIATSPWRGRVEGLAVLHLGFEDRGIAALVDWLVPIRATGVAEALLERCHAMAAASGLRQMVAWFPEYAPQFRLLQAHGYRSDPTPYEILARRFVADLPLDWVAEHWYYTMGDSDIY